MKEDSLSLWWTQNTGVPNKKTFDGCFVVDERVIETKNRQREKKVYNKRNINTADFV
jgi:hypothetical protein